MNEDFKSLQPLEILLDESPQLNLQEISNHPDINWAKISLAMPSDSLGGLGNKFGKLDMLSFGVGFCCWPYGIGYLLVKGEVTREEKRSYCLGVVSSLNLTFSTP